MKVHFNDMFTVQDGMVSPKVVVSIGGATMSPSVSFGGGVSFGGVDLTQYIGKYLEVTVANNIHTITGLYQ